MPNAVDDFVQSAAPVQPSASNPVDQFVSGHAPAILQSTPADPFPAAVRQYDPLVQKAASAHNVPAGLLSAIMTHESGGRNLPAGSNPKSTASGVMQFLAGTAKQYGVNPTDPASAIDGAARYLSDLKARTGSWRSAVTRYRGVDDEPYINGVMQMAGNPDGVPYKAPPGAPITTPPAQLLAADNAAKPAFQPGGIHRPTINPSSINPQVMAHLRAQYPGLAPLALAHLAANPRLVAPQRTSAPPNLLQQAGNVGAEVGAAITHPLHQAAEAVDKGFIEPLASTAEVAPMAAMSAMGVPGAQRQATYDVGQIGNAAQPLAELWQATTPPAIPGHETPQEQATRELHAGRIASGVVPDAEYAQQITEAYNQGGNRAVTKALGAIQHQINRDVPGFVVEQLPYVFPLLHGALVKTGMVSPEAPEIDEPAASTPTETPTNAQPVPAENGALKPEDLVEHSKYGRSIITEIRPGGEAVIKSADGFRTVPVSELTAAKEESHADTVESSMGIHGDTSPEAPARLATGSAGNVQRAPEPRETTPRAEPTEQPEEHPPTPPVNTASPAFKELVRVGAWDAKQSGAGGVPGEGTALGKAATAFRAHAAADPAWVLGAHERTSSPTMAARLKVLADEAKQPPHVATVPEKPVTATTQTPSATLPAHLEKSAPRYNYGTGKSFTLNFPDDVTRSLYIVANKTPSKADAEFMGFLRNHLPGKSDAQLRLMGQSVRESIKPLARDAKMPPVKPGEAQKPGVLTVPKHGFETGGTTPRAEPVSTVPDKKQEFTGNPNGEPVVGGPRVVGSTGVTHTPDNQPINFHYEVLPVDRVVTSHTSGFTETQGYDQGLQPRDRDRTAAMTQVSSIAQDLNPARVGESASTAEGAPILGPDLQTESGNGRSMAIRAAYETGGDQAKGYRQSLVDNAEKYGMSPEEVGKIDNPVLVRIRDTPVDSIDKRYDLVRRMGESTVARMSEPETAKADAAKLMRGSALDVLDTSNDLHGPTNRPFVRAFMDGVPHSERPDLVTEDGGLSAQGLRRVRNAILATAYGNDATVARMTESLDDNIKGVGNAMVQAAPGFAKLKQLIDSGARTPELDITADVTAAANALSHIRESRSHLKEYFDQLGLFGKGLTPVGEELLRAFDKYKSSPKKMAMVLKGYTEQADTTDDPRQSSMFDDKPPATPDSLLRAALNFVETANRDNEATLGFETTPGPETRSNRAGLPETEARGGNETAPAEVSSAESTREAPKGITPVHDQSSYEFRSHLGRACNLDRQNPPTSRPVRCRA